MKLTVITICLNNVDELRRTIRSVTTQAKAPRTDRHPSATRL